MAARSSAFADACSGNGAEEDAKLLGLAGEVAKELGDK